MNGNGFQSPVFNCSTSSVNMTRTTVASHAKRTLPQSSVPQGECIAPNTMQLPLLQQDVRKNDLSARDKILLSKLDPASISLFQSIVDVSPYSFTYNNTHTPLTNSGFNQHIVTRPTEMTMTVPQLNSRMSSQEILNVTNASSIDHLLLSRNTICDASSLSDLNPTITPVHLDNSSNLFEDHSSIKDVFITTENHYAKEPLITSPSCTAKESVSTSGASSNVLLNKLLQSNKLEPVNIPNRTSEFSKIPNRSLKVISAPKIDNGPLHTKQNIMTRNAITNCVVSSGKDHYDYRTNCTASVTNCAMPSPMVVITSASHPHSQTNNDTFLLPDCLRSLETTQPVGISSSSFHEPFHLHPNSLVTASTSSPQLLYSHPQITDKKCLSVAVKTSKDTYHPDDSLAKGTRLHPNNSLPEYQVENRTEQLLIGGGDPLFTSTPNITNIDSAQSLSFISDQQFQQMADIASKDPRSCKPGDILLPQLHSEDDEIHYNTLTNSMAAELSSAMGTTPSPVVSEPSLSAAIGDEHQNLPELPPSPILANIPADFLAGHTSAPKTSPCQQTLQAFLPSLSTDLTLSLSTPLFEGIDMSSLSEGDASFAESLDVSSQKRGTAGIELNFTNAFKQITDKGLCDQTKSKVFCNIFQSPKLATSVNSCYDLPKSNTSQPDIKEDRFKMKSPAVKGKVFKQETFQSVPEFEHRDEKIDNKSDTILISKDESFMQQVSCFKCVVCSYLCLEKNDMAEHMQTKHKKLQGLQEIPSKNKEIKENQNMDEKKRKPARRKKAPNSKKTLGNSEPVGLDTRLSTPMGEEPVISRSDKRRRTQQEKIKTPSIEPEINPDEPASIDSEDFEKINSKDKEYSPLEDEINESSSTNESLESPPKKQAPSKKTSRAAGQSTAGAKPRKKTTAVVAADNTLGFRCGVNGCGHRMKDEENIRYHRQCHVGAFLSCPECQNTFPQWSALAMHLWKVHLIDMDLHKCTQCDYKSYSHNKLMNTHFRSHSNERPFLCDVCGKDFKTAKQLRSHKSLHTEKAPGKKETGRFNCERCNRGFAEKRMLFSHLDAVHKKVKPFLCNFCGKSFASKSTLNLHIRKHTGEKPFACESCEYRTSDHNSMRRHKMKHSNNKRYACPYCDYSSIQSSTFKVHLRRKHEIQAQKDGIIFSCSMCSFKTVKRDNFLAHMGTQHNATDEEQNRTADLQQQQFNQLQSKENVAQDNQNMNKALPVQLPILPETILPDISVTPINPEEENKNESRQTYYVMQVPHVVNIDVNNGDAMEVPQSTSLVNGVLLKDLSYNVICPTSLGPADEYDGAIVQQIDMNDGFLQLSRDVVSANLGPSVSCSSDSVIYVAANEANVNCTQSPVDVRRLCKEEWQ